MKNLVIEINETQALEEVVKELERLGYKSDEYCNTQTRRKPVRHIEAFEDGVYSAYPFKPWEWDEPLITTLNELKQMT